MRATGVGVDLNPQAALLSLVHNGEAVVWYVSVCGDEVSRLSSNTSAGR